MAKEGLSKEEWRGSKTAENIYGKDGDYNLTNQIIEDMYKVFRFLPCELIEKCNVQFSMAQNKPLKYMSVDSIMECISCVRELNMYICKGNVESVINFFEHNKDETQESIYDEERNKRIEEKVQI